MQESEVTNVRARDYLPLLWFLVAGILGATLMCGAASIGFTDINNAVSVGTPTAGVVDFVISNMNTLIVETVQGFSNSEAFPTATPTLVPSNTVVAVNDLTISPTLSFLLFGRTATHLPNPLTMTLTHTLTPVPTKTLAATPTKTPTLVPTHTLIPTSTDTYTPIPTDTDTPVPPTATNIPTDTPVPPTDTSVPPTDTSAPPTDTATP